MVGTTVLRQGKKDSEVLAYVHAAREGQSQDSDFGCLVPEHMFVILCSPQVTDVVTQAVRFLLLRLRPEDGAMSPQQ